MGGGCTLGQESGKRLGAEGESKQKKESRRRKQATDSPGNMFPHTSMLPDWLRGFEISSAFFFSSLFLPLVTDIVYPCTVAQFNTRSAEKDRCGL